MHDRPSRFTWRVRMARRSSPPRIFSNCAERGCPARDQNIRIAGPAMLYWAAATLWVEWVSDAPDGHKLCFIRGRRTCSGAASAAAGASTTTVPGLADARSSCPGGYTPGCKSVCSRQARHIAGGWWKVGQGRSTLRLYGIERLQGPSGGERVLSASVPEPARLASAFQDHAALAIPAMPDDAAGALPRCSRQFRGRAFPLREPRKSRSV